MQIGEIVQPRAWIALIGSPAVIQTRHSARKCCRYLRKKESIAVHPLHDRNLELVYEIRPREMGFRVFRKLGGLELKNSPMGFDVTVEEDPPGAEIELRFTVPRWAIVTLGSACTLLLLLAVFVMEWWPSLLTLLMLLTLALAALHVAATDRRELERFLVERFADQRQDGFQEEDWDV